MSFLVLYYYQFQDYQFLLLQAYQHLGEVDIPKFTVIVAQKNHHTKLFQAGGGTENVPPGLTLSYTVYFNVFHGARCVYSLPLSFSPGTVVDTKIVHPRNYDFYMCAHAGMIVCSYFICSFTWLDRC